LNSYFLYAFFCPSYYETLEKQGHTVYVLARPGEKRCYHKAILSYILYVYTEL